MNFIAVILALILAACSSCAPRPHAAAPVAPVAVSDAGAPSVSDAGPIPDVTPGVRLACEAITAAGCPEGGPACYGVLQKAVDEHITVVPLACLVGATDKASVRACGPFVACP